jgi:hypothetical protein
VDPEQAERMVLALERIADALEAQAYGGDDEAGEPVGHGGLDG